MAIRIDVATGEVTRTPLSVERFHPFAATESGVWFIGPGSAVSHLNPRTLPVDASSEQLGVTVGDAALDPATSSLWIANELGSIVRVDLR